MLCLQILAVFILFLFRSRALIFMSRNPLIKVRRFFPWRWKEKTRIQGPLCCSLGLCGAVMLLDWIGAGSGARSNPVQKVRPAGSWFSSRDPVALFPFSAISKQIQSGEMY